MNTTFLNQNHLEKIINIALTEDLEPNGDITSENTIDHDKVVDFFVGARESMVVCIEQIAKAIFANAKINYSILKKDGDFIMRDEIVITGKGKAIDILRIERVFLNFVQHSCGIATITRQFVEKVHGTGAVIRDTRKTTPGMRYLEKYAVGVGGGQSYRMSLSDKILIKDNHIASCNGVKNAIEKIRENLGNVYIAVECDKMHQVKEAVDLRVNMILLDNMKADEIALCVKLVKNSAVDIKLEASGGINLQNVQEIAKTGVDYISVGMLTHSAPSKDIGIDINAA